MDVSSCYISEWDEECRKRRTGKSEKKLFSSEAISELQKLQGQRHEHLKEYQHGVWHHLPEDQQQVQVQQVASNEVVEFLRHELSQSLAEGSHYQNLYTTSRNGASRSSSEIVQLRHERGQLTVHGHNLKTEKLTCQNAVQIPRLMRMLQVEWALEQQFWSCLKIWRGRKKSLPSCKLAAMNFGHHPDPHKKCAKWRISFSNAGEGANGRNPAWICCHRSWKNGCCPWLKEWNRGFFVAGGWPFADCSLQQFAAMSKRALRVLTACLREIPRNVMGLLQERCRSFRFLSRLWVRHGLVRTFPENRKRVFHRADRTVVRVRCSR